MVEPVGAVCINHIVWGFIEREILPLSIYIDHEFKL